VTSEIRSPRDRSPTDPGDPFPVSMGLLMGPRHPALPVLIVVGLLVGPGGVSIFT
jgi:hypothetical protein